MNKIEKARKRINSDESMDNHYLVHNNEVRHLLAALDSQKAIAELAIKALEQIDSIRETFPLGAHTHHVARGFDRAEIIAGKALEEIKRISTEGVSQ